MKKTKMFYGNQFVGSFVCDGKRYTRFELLKLKAKRIARSIAIITVIGSTATASLYAAYQAGKHFNPVTIYAKETVEVAIDSPSPVMERIAKCESGGTHYKNGQVVFKANSNGTVDIGIMQINSVHAKKAAELGYDLTKEEDNKAFAYYLYKNFGTEPWYASRKCWNK